MPLNEYAHLSGDVIKLHQRVAALMAMPSLPKWQPVRLFRDDQPPTGEPGYIVVPYARSAGCQRPAGFTSL
jgi:hypothetical protein